MIIQLAPEKAGAPTRSLWRLQRLLGLVHPSKAFGYYRAMRLTELLLHSPNPVDSQRFLDTNLPFVSEPTNSAFAQVRYVAPSGLAQGVDNYWKFSVFADSVDRVATAIHQAGVDCSSPIQFGDIGWLCHFNEPGGNTVEILGRRFQPPRQPLSDAGFNGPTSLGLVTLRTADIDGLLHILMAGLAMKPLATMEVTGGDREPFKLDFLALTAEDPPNPDLSSVENREWLYQRPYTVIEIQYGTSVTGDATAGSPIGLASIGFESSDLAGAKSRLSEAGVTWSEADSGTITVTTPDGHVLRIYKS